MTLTIELDPGVEVRLHELAMRRGVPMAEYVKEVLEQQAFQADAHIDRPLYETLTPDEWAKAFLEWTAGHRTDTPVIPLKALRREDLYEDRGL